MRALWRLSGEFLRNEDGPTAVEYAVMLAFIIIVCIAAITSLGQSVSTSFSAANGAFS
jgi:pilus assembly protein Flp/PilA